MISLSSFPNELVIRILDTLASSDRKSCLSLCLVSSWTYRIALPHLLHTVTITEKNHRAFIEEIINNQRSASVKQLWIATRIINDFSIIASCTSITALTVSSDLIVSFKYENSPPGSFQFLTHLCITHSPLSRWNTDFVSHMFPRLTHFADVVHSANDLKFHRVLLKVYGAQLVMVVARMLDTWDDTAVAWLKKVRKEDKRAYLVSLNAGACTDDESEWDVWDRARKETQSVLVWDGMS